MPELIEPDTGDVEAEDMTDDEWCPECRGTGIGQFGDPDTSKCASCRGTGKRRESIEDMWDRVDREMDDGRDMERER